MEVSMASGHYIYMQDLRALDQCVPQEVVPLPAALCRVQTPLVGREWQAELSHHPDREYMQYIISGITSGFELDLIILTTTATVQNETCYPLVNTRKK
jgi:hypothetical protein